MLADRSISIGRWSELIFVTTFQLLEARSEFETRLMSGEVLEVFVVLCGIIFIKYTKGFFSYGFSKLSASYVFIGFRELGSQVASCPSPFFHLLLALSASSFYS